jgi:hypothetical protein
MNHKLNLREALKTMSKVNQYSVQYTDWIDPETGEHIAGLGTYFKFWFLFYQPLFEIMFSALVGYTISRLIDMVLEKK